MKVAAVNWALRPSISEGGFFDHLGSVLEQGAGCSLIVLPEQFSLELLGGTGQMIPIEEPRWLAGHFDGILDRLCHHAKELNATIIGGSHFSERDNQIYNVNPIIQPDGSYELQTKNKLTTYEREIWQISPGTGLLRPKNRVGTLICYDAEFPEAVRSLAEGWCEVLCVPAFTETRRGFQRVRWSCLARAVENQIFVVHTSLVGRLGREPVPEAYGTSAIIAPSVEPFPDKAILSKTKLNEEGVAIAEIDFEMLKEARNGGDVRNWNDRAPDCWGLRDS